jgi:hypothetical protein
LKKVFCFSSWFRQFEVSGMQPVQTDVMNNLFTWPCG